MLRAQVDHTFGACASSDPWYLVQVKPNSWHIAERNLVRQGISVFAPRELVTRRRRGIFVDVIQPLFPGYIFASLDPGLGLWRKVNSTLGVARLVSFSKNQPTTVPSALVEGLRLRCAEGDVLRPVEEFRPGDDVAFKFGPFADFVGVVETMLPNRRVFVMLDIMGSATRITVDAENLRTNGSFSS